MLFLRFYVSAFFLSFLFSSFSSVELLSSVDKLNRGNTMVIDAAEWRLGGLKLNLEELKEKRLKMLLRFEC